MSRQQIHATMRNSVAIEEISVATKVEKNHQSMSQHSKEGCNKVEELEKKTYVVIKDEEETTEDCHDKEIYVATKFRAVENDKLYCNKALSHNTTHSCHDIN